MKEIKLSKGMVALVDDEDYEYLNQFKWYLTHSHYKHYYAIRSVCVNKKYKSIRMHRDIMMPNHNQEIDHIDHNGLNNQKLNLRICSRAENSRNRTPIGESKYLFIIIFIGVYKQYCLKHLQDNRLEEMVAIEVKDIKRYYEYPNG